MGIPLFCRPTGARARPSMMLTRPMQVEGAVGFFRTTVMRLKLDNPLCSPTNWAHWVNGQTLPWNMMQPFLLRTTRCVVITSCFLAAYMAAARVLERSPVLRSSLFEALLEIRSSGIRQVCSKLFGLFSARCVTYPLQIQPVPGRGVVVDEERYQVTLCPRCQPERLAHLTRPVEGYSCKAHLLKRCPDCSSKPEGCVLKEELEEVEIFLPTKLYVSLANMRFAKDGYEKRNVHVGWGALCEHTALDPTHEAYATALPLITRLQNTRAFQLPWLVSAVMPNWTIFLFVGPAIPNQACWATRWKQTKPGSSPSDVPQTPVVHTTAQRLDVQVQEFGGLPGRVASTTPEQVETLGLTGRAPQPTVGDTGLHPSSQLLPMSIDGRHAVDRDQTAERVAPVLGNACFYASKGHSGEANALHALAERIQDPHASIRKFSYGPSAAHKKTVRKCLNVVTQKWFTEERVRSYLLEMGQLQDMLHGKLSEADTRRMVDELLAGVEVSETVDAMVKREVTAKATKPPRLVMDRGLHRFLIAAAACKVAERGLTELDEPCNIKHAPKDERMDALSETLSEEQVFGPPERGGLPMHFKRSETLLVENDFSTYEYTQALEFQTDAQGRRCKWAVTGFDEVDLGLLSMERDLIKHVCDLVGTVLNELYPLAEQVLLPQVAKTELKPKGHKDKTSFYRPNWRLVLFLRIRCSGDNQTSWGNRFNQFVPFSIATLGENAPQFWHRLIDFAEKKADPTKASSWIFSRNDGKVRKQVYWRPFGEGDDHLTQLNTGEAVGTSPETTPSLQRVAATLESFGLTHNLVLVDPSGGRAEFVGCHFYGVEGCLMRGAWVPDMARGMISSCFTTSEALGRKTPATCMRTSLSFRSRAVMYKGRCDPMFQYYDQLADEWLARSGSADGDVSFKLEWSMAQFMGKELGDMVTCREVSARADTVIGPNLPRDLQLKLAEASLQGKMTAAEWGAWNAIGVTIDSDPEIVLSALPEAFRARLRKAD